MTKLEYELIPVDKIPESTKKKNKTKIDTKEVKYMQKEFPNAYGADYVQDIYKRFGKKENKKDVCSKKEISES